ncbi:BamA/TamA family outer membrane protein [Reichenbachiella versicolor]|uniref:hypothetical protein n=1 Tax=Reichenbachiella versicolor TaxID=1821036 RepID=UPI0013A5934A|nr:hypothetical protein [Reichenbachiella versicolor]
MNKVLQLFLLLLTFLGWQKVCAQKQTSTPEAKINKVSVKGDRFLLLDDDVYYIPHDTIIYVADTVDVLIRKNSLQKTQAFYDSVEHKMSKSKISSMVYDALFVHSDKKPHNEKASEQRFSHFENEKIQSIKYKHLPIFGSRISDTTHYKPNKYTKPLNDIHVHTRNWIIRKNILFEEGSNISSEDMVESERLLRRLDFVRDARIMINEIDGKAEVAVVTRDVFPYNVEVNPSNDNGALLGISHINIGGMGHQLEFDYVDWTEYELFYTVPNILGTFIDGQVDFSQHFNKRGLGVNFDKDFVTRKTEYGGGIEFSQFKFGEFNYDPILDESEEFYYKRRRQDLWIGRSFLTNIRMPYLGFEDKTYAVVSARRDNQDFFDKPEVRIDTNYFYHDRIISLIGIGLTSREYYKDKFILNFGRTEDIPTGAALSLTMGIERREFEDRLYLGAVYARGGYISGFGYLNSIYSLGGYRGESGFSDGILSMQFDYFSRLSQLGQYKFRQFASLSFAQAIKPTEDIFISGQSDIGIRGLNGFYLKSTSKLNLKVESLVFTPINFLSFRVATFAFFDVTGVSNYINPFFSPDVFYATGLGLRFRNDNIAISTIQIRFGIYPRQPLNGNPSFFEFSTSPRLGIRDFDFKAPEIIPFN